MASQQPADPALLSLVAAYQDQTVALRERLARYVTALWRSFSYHDDRAMRAFVHDLVPVSTGAQRQIAALTVAFIAHQRQIALGSSFKPVAVDPELVTGPAVRNGTPPDTVASRPFLETWAALHDLPHTKESVDKALTKGERRAVSIVTTDLQRAKSLTQRQITRSDRRVSYTRRILEGGHSCGLCIVASTQRYHAAQLQPMHPGCDCGQEVVWSGQDPGQILDLSSLQGVHERIESRFGSSSSAAGIIPGAVDSNDLPLRYRDVLVTHDHGELGPVLAVKGQAFSAL